MNGRTERDASLREVMGSYPTGVTIVAATEADGVPFGLTVNSFTSVSLDPPLVLVCIGHTSASHDRLVSSTHFSVNVLSDAQDDVAGRFAREPSEGRFDEVPWRMGDLGCPLIDESVGWLECSVHEVLSGGDHSIVVGRVEKARVTDRSALLFHRGRLGSSHG